MTNIIDNFSDSELKLINNVMDKLNSYMAKNSITMYSMCQTLGFSYQPFYRLSKKQNLPSIPTLVTIADLLKCNVSELLSDECFLDINLVTDLTSLPKFKSSKKVRIYLNSDEYVEIMNYDFFCVQSNANEFNMYKSIDTVISDGKFLIKYENKMREMNVTSSSSKFIVVEDNNMERKISLEEITPFGKFYKKIFVTSCNEDFRLGSVLN